MKHVVLKFYGNTAKAKCGMNIDVSLKHEIADMVKHVTCDQCKKRKRSRKKVKK